MGYKIITIIYACLARRAHTVKGSFSRKCGSTILFTYTFFAQPRQFVSVFMPLAKLRILYCTVCVPGHRDIRQQRRNGWPRFFFCNFFHTFSVPSIDDNGVPMFVYNIIYNVPPRYAVTGENHNAAGRNI